MSSVGTGCTVCLSVCVAGLHGWNLAILKASSWTSRENDPRVKRQTHIAPTSLPPGVDGGAVYIRWGMTTCPTDTNTALVYDGVAGGSHSEMSGGGSEYLCLPRVPQWHQHSEFLVSDNVTTPAPTTTPTTPASSRNRRRQGRRPSSETRTQTTSGSRSGPSPTASQSAYIYGGEFRGRAYFGRDNLRADTFVDQDVVCAVCFSTVRRSQLMIPGRRQCYLGWTKEYEGFLMTAQSSARAQHHYACVYNNPEADQKGYERKGGALFYPVRAVCGSLPCPNYVQGREMTCVVCTR